MSLPAALSIACAALLLARLAACGGPRRRRGPRRRCLSRRSTAAWRRWAGTTSPAAVANSRRSPPTIRSRPSPRSTWRSPASTVSATATAPRRNGSSRGVAGDPSWARARVLAGPAAALRRTRSRGLPLLSEVAADTPGDAFPAYFAGAGPPGGRARGSARRGSPRRRPQSPAAQRLLRRVPGPAAAGPRRPKRRRCWRSSRRSNGIRAPRWPSSSTRGWARWPWP